MSRERLAVDDVTERVARVILWEIYNRKVSDTFVISEAKTTSCVHSYQIAQEVLKQIGDQL